MKNHTYVRFDGGQLLARRARASEMRKTTGWYNNVREAAESLGWRSMYSDGRNDSYIGTDGCIRTCPNR